MAVASGCDYYVKILRENYPSPVCSGIKSASHAQKILQRRQRVCADPSVIGQSNWPGIANLRSLLHERLQNIKLDYISVFRWYMKCIISLIAVVANNTSLWLQTSMYHPRSLLRLRLTPQATPLSLFHRWRSFNNFGRHGIQSRDTCFRRKGYYRNP